VHFLGLARALIAMGVKVEILAQQPSGPLSMPLEGAEGITFTPALARLPSSMSIPMMWRQLRRLSPAGNLYVRSGIGTLALVRAARGFGYKKIIVEANGWLSDDLAAGLSTAARHGAPAPRAMPAAAAPARPAPTQGA
jgi:hypothetical protein